MNNVKFINAVLEGDMRQGVPVTACYHFGQQHLNGETHAKLEVEYYRHFKPDILKVMNDYSFPCPDGLHYISEPDDIEAYSSSVGHRLPYQEQLKVISTLKNELGEEVMFWDTVFNPWFTIRRHLLFKDINLYMRMHGTLLHKMLDEVTDCLINYIHKSFENGVKGIYFSVPASESFISYNDFREFMLPYDLKLIESVKHLGILFLHIHGAGNIYYNDLFSQYHYNGVSWADQTVSIPVLVPHTF